MFKRTFLAATLAVCLVFSSCTKKPVTDPTQPPPAPLTPQQKAELIIKDAKKYGPLVAVAIEEGIKQEALFAANGTIDPAIEPKIKQLLLDAKSAVDAFNAKAATWTSFDSTKKADIAKLIRDGLDFVEKINNDGVLKIKNAQSQQIAAGILSTARVALTLWQINFNEATQ
jgi:hypothetical protein